MGTQPISYTPECAKHGYLGSLRTQWVVEEADSFRNRAEFLSPICSKWSSCLVVRHWSNNYHKFSQKFQMRQNIMMVKIRKMITLI